LFFGFKRDLNSYLAANHFGPGAAVDGQTTIQTLADVIAFNKKFTVSSQRKQIQIGLKYGQTLAIASDTLDPASTSDTSRYQSDRAKDLGIAKTRGLDEVFKHYDAVLFAANRGANIAARAGYPSIAVPGGFVENPALPPERFAGPNAQVTPFPAGFNAKGAPYAVTFTGPAFSEPKLIGYAYAFEQATHHRRSPDSTPPLSTDTVTH